MKLVALLAFALAAITATTDWQTLGKQWWAHVQYLASDSLAGRGTGTAGFEQAANYMEQEFKAAGLTPAGSDGFRQPIDLEVVQIEPQQSSLALLREKQAEPLTLGEDAVINVHAQTVHQIEAPLVFAGYGLSVPEMKYDDLHGQNVRGKIVVYLTGGPADMPGPVKAHFQSGEERSKALMKAGAVGTISLQNPHSAEVPWSRVAAGSLLPRMQLSQTRSAAAPLLPLSVTFNPAYAQKLFAGSGHSFEELVADASGNRPMPHFPLTVKLRAQVGVKRSQVKSENVAGAWMGSDAALRNEYVIVSAHLDHLGIGQAVHGDGIYNGAMDDASGDASLIEIARAMREAKVKPRRSILFLSVTGEEKGELGSGYFAAHPTVKGRIVADINMDMYLPLFPLKYLEVQGLAESTLGDDIRAVASQAGVEVQADKEPEHNRFIRSDQYSFIKKGVPSLAFKFGYIPGTPEEKTFKAWYSERYHGPADDTSQPVDVEAAAQFNSILEQLALRVANADTKPEWKADSFFRRFAH